MGGSNTSQKKTAARGLARGMVARAGPFVGCRSPPTSLSKPIVTTDRTMWSSGTVESEALDQTTSAPNSTSSPASVSLACLAAAGLSFCYLTLSPGRSLPFWCRINPVTVPESSFVNEIWALTTFRKNIVSDSANIANLCCPVS